MGTFVAIALVCLLAGASMVAGVRYARRKRISDPEWQRRWKLADRSTRRRVRKAVRDGRTLADPTEAYLASGVAIQQLRGFAAMGGWRQWVHSGGALLGVVLAVVRGGWAFAAFLSLAAAGAFSTPVLIRRRRPRIEAALHGNREVARQAGITPPAESPATLHPS